MTEAMQQLFDEKAEREVLGSILLEPHLLRINDLLYEEFFIQRYGYLYRLMRWMDANGKTIDLLTVQQELERKDKLDWFGGFAELADLAQIVTTYHYETQCQHIRDYSNRRRALKVVQELGRAVLDTRKEFTVGEFINELMQTELGKTKTFSMTDGLLQFDQWAVDRIDKNLNGTLDQYPKSGIEEIDKALIFLEGGQTTRIAGEPGVGKTMLVTQIFEQANCARVYFSMEMLLHRLVARMLSARTNIPVSLMRTGLGGDAEALLQKLRDTYRGLEAEEMFINCSPTMTIEGMYSEIAKLKAQGHDVKLIAIDYFGLISEPGAHENQTIKEGIISQKLQRLVKELDVHALVIDTYNKEGFGKDRGSMRAVGGAATKSYDSDNVLTLTVGDVTASGVEIYADMVKSRDGEMKERRFGLIREISKPVIRSMTAAEREAMRQKVK